jgi:DNA-binding transcriptional LysR family regulator
MTFEQLRVFVAVAERAHVTQAAAVLGMTQPSASAAIAALEAGLGTRLFDRVGRGIALTEAGRLLLPEARAVLARLAQAGQALDDLQGLRRGHLALAASQTISGYWLPARLHRFHLAWPAVSLALSIGNTEQVARAVLEGAAEIGFIEGEISEPLLARIPVADDRMVLVAPAGHELAEQAGAGQAVLTCADLASLRWVLRESGSGTRQVLETMLRQTGLDPDSLDVALELPSNEAVCAAVEAGAGVTAISRLVTGAALAAGRLVELPFSLPVRQFLAICHGDRHRSRAVTALLAQIRAEGTSG